MLTWNYLRLPSTGHVRWVSDLSSIHGVLPTDNVSIFSHSTNSTASNLVGAGRILGSLYSSTGRRLEKSMGNIAHKAGLGPEAIYQRISTLDVEDWKRDSEKG